MDTKEPITAAGTLYICATPIGNLGDITYRAVQTLREADLIAAEDTRNSLKLLNHLDIHTPMTSYHEHNKYEKAAKLVEELKAGKSIALITDAGMPCISDPGQVLVNMCHEEGISVTVLPGASACISALAISGMDTRGFCFDGFLPPDKKQREKVLNRLAVEERTTVFYEAPHHLKKTLKVLEGAVGSERKLTLCRELTKKHEEIIRATLGECISLCEEKEPRGEYVLVLEGAGTEELLQEKRQAFDGMSLMEHLDLYLSAGMDKKEAMKEVARDRGISRREVYSEYERNKEDHS